MGRTGFLAWAWAAVAAVGLATGAAWAQDAGFERGELEIDGANGSHRFAIELARTPEQKARGLMFRRQLAADAGMLFVYPADREITMWMKNTLIPLDMLFIASDGRIVNIVERTVPLSTQVIGSGVPARGVLEVNGGTAKRLGIEPGDRVRYPAFAPDD